MDFLSANRVLFYVLGIIAFFAFFWFLFLSAPSSFPVGTIFKISEGENLHKVSSDLKERNIIRSRIAFEAFVVLLGGEKHIYYADYSFERSLPVYEVARRIAKGDHRTPPVRVTIPEGFNTKEIADTFASKLTNFNRTLFLEDTKELEGYLFPDTYYFYNTDTEQQVIKYMSANFNKKITPIRPEIAKSGKTEKEIVIMASVIEREAHGDDDRELIAGILWKRFNMGMPLQVDAAPETYKTKGLPKSPIGNPGLKALLAALHPKNSLYLYYLHDKNGAIHYAKTFAEHVKNRLKYLP